MPANGRIGLLGDGRVNRTGEYRLSALWYREAFARPGLRTSCGRRVRVLYRGLPNGDRGPDYLGAVLSLGRGRPRAGDIELHMRTSQWRAHGHHLDSNYNSVILHVVWEDDDPRPTVPPSGRRVPVLALAGLAPRAVGVSSTGEPCRQAPGRGPDGLRAVLERAGEKRFLGRAACLEGDLAVFPPEEVLYRALAEGLGYSRNKEPFRRLASYLPLVVLQGFLWGKGRERQEPLAQALFLGTAGLLPSQRGMKSPDRWPALLELLWTASGLERSLALKDWSLGVRPENHPARRLAGLASMVVDSLGEGLVDWALKGVRVQGPAPGAGPGTGFRAQGTGYGYEFSTAQMGDASGPDPRPYSMDPTLWSRLQREAVGYWRGNFDFDRPGVRLSPSLVGRERALELAVNAVLPFAYAYGQALNDASLSQASLDAYGHLPSPGCNQVTRHMARQVLGASPGRLAGTARRQQGLLHLFRHYCTVGKCGACPINPRPLTLDSV